MSSTGKFSLIAARFWQAIPAIVGIVIVTFLLTRALPGDPAAHFAGPTASKESIDEIRKQFGFDRSWPEQFVVYIGQLARGDLGNSLSTGQPVVEEIASRLPASLELSLAALLLSTSIAIPLGILAATRPDSWVDHLCRFVTTAGVSLPTFFTGILLVYIFYFILGWAPAPMGRLNVVYLSPPHVTGLYTIDSLLAGDLETFRASLSQLILPALTLGVFTLAPLARMTRGSMLQVLGADFVRTARAAGLSGRKVLFTYALRNALFPVITTLGMVFSFTLGANVLVEKVFAWPGIGSFAIEALVASDYAAVQGFVLAMAMVFVVLNLLIDITYTLVDPRVGIEG